MAGKEEQTLAKTYQSDQGETEDEEVKRNCVMGESGISDSDFSDSDFEMENVDNEVRITDEMKETSDAELKKDRIEDLVKFVSAGSQILKPKGVALYRPTPIVPSLAIPAENDETSNESNVKSSLSTTYMNVRSGFSPTSKADNEIEISVIGISSSSSDSDSDSSNCDNESVESDTDMKSTSLEFPFDGEEEFSMEVGIGIPNIAPDTEEGCCKSSLDDQQEAPEIIIGGYALVGASGASVDDKWLMAKQKRVLSSNTLSALNQDAGRNSDVPKKMRFSQQSFRNVCAIPDITLGTEALDQIIQPLPRQYLVRDNSLLIPSSSDDEEDKMLSEELEEKFRNNNMRCSAANLPIPLLTLPQSPRTVDDTIEGQSMASVEWPSNLVMDIAIMKAFANVPLVSTKSIRAKQSNNDSSSILAVVESSKRNSAPRLRTVSVGTS